MSSQLRDFPRATRYAQKNVTFHLDFGSEIVDQVRYERLTFYSLEHLRLADKALGRPKVE